LEVGHIHAPREEQEIGSIVLQKQHEKHSYPMGAAKNMLKEQLVSLFGAAAIMYMAPL
jgi:hypothetical protein